LGGGGYAGGTTLILSNCTVLGNSAGSGGGVYGANGGSFYNCIISYNSASTGSDVFGGDLSYCCTPAAAGNSNISNDPGLIDPNAGDYHLRTNSPCVNSGKNALAPIGLDLDGNARIAGGTVDIGAYELQSPASRISFAWLLKYGLATDGSADNADPDADGMNNWQEWRCQTDPTNALSFLQIQPVSSSYSGNVVTWQGVNGVSYYLQRTSDLPGQPFATIRSNLPGQDAPIAVTDTAPGKGPFLYRVGVY
jgi:hypothetical protein